MGLSYTLSLREGESMEEGYSICLNKWALDKDIKSELGLLLIISSLCAEKGYCYASNKYLAELFDISEVAVSQRIKKLEEKGYIDVSYEKRGCEIISREIRLKLTLTDDLRKLKPTIKENLKENNTSINNIYPPISPQGGKSRKAKLDLSITEITEILDAYEGSNELKQTLLDFIEERRKKRKPVSANALKLLLKKLDALASQEKEKIEIVEQSIMNGWTGFFPLRKNSVAATQRDLLDEVLKEMEKNE